MKTITAMLGLAFLAGTQAASQEETRSAPGDPDERLEEELRRELSFVDPQLAGSPSEAWNSITGARLSALGKALSVSDEAVGEAVGALVSEGFVCGPLRPSELETVFEDGTLRVERPGPGGAEAPALRGAEGLARALRAMRSPWSAPSEVHAKFKTFRVDERADEVETRVIVLVWGPAESRFVQQNAHWTCRWSAAEESGPTLLSIQVDFFEEVSCASGTLLAERTAGVFPVDADEARWLTTGIGELRRTLDTRLGIPLLGHPSGIAVGDVDGDGLEDLYLCQTGGVPNRLLLRRPDGTVRDASAGSGVDFMDFSRGALLVDLDGDRDRDLVVAVVNDLVFLSNDGQGRFEEQAAVELPNPTTISAADYDLDGDLDVYACAYFNVYDGGAFPLPYHDARNGQPNLMLQNQGDWSFADVTVEVGLDRNNRRFSFAASWADYDVDGDPDLYVANDFGRNNLYRNDGDTFVDVAAEAGVEDISAGMGVSWGDYDGDGRPDLYVSNMYSSAGNRVTYQRNFKTTTEAEVRGHFQRHSRGNSLFRNAGDGTFVDVSVEAGVTMGRWAWGSRFVDLNNDGWLDLMSPNGFLTHDRKDDL